MDQRILMIENYTLMIIALLLRCLLITSTNRTESITWHDICLRIVLQVYRPLVLRFKFFIIRSIVTCLHRRVCWSVRSSSRNISIFLPFLTLSYSLIFDVDVLLSSLILSLIIMKNYSFRAETFFIRS